MAGRTSAARLLSSTAVNTIVGALGILVPLAAFLSEQELLRNVFVTGCATLVVGIVSRDQWLKSQQLMVPRGIPSSMADEEFYRSVARDVTHRTIGDMEDLADGHLRVFASEVPYVSVLLFRTLISLESSSKSVQAADLTSDPRVLLTRRDYLAVNRQLVRAGGSVQRVFICRTASLADQQFAVALLELIDQHRAVGVTCGIAVRERLRPTEAVDFVVVARAAVLVEDEQGSIGYDSGRSTVHFKRVEVWRDRFASIWESNETPAATEQLARFEPVVRHMVSSGVWQADSVTDVLEAV